ncbi:MAG: hypothetical protein JNG88_07085 [Phycisphaerales bacterium]|nr:hypothetical protein [Phycisphaerales bacterium]
MQKSRFLAVCGSAVAATFALFAFFSSWQPSGAAMAATIFRTLRETAHRGVSVTFENIEAEGVHVNGRVQLLFPTPISLAQLADEQADFPKPEALYVDLKVKSDETSSATGEADVEVTSALTPTSKWAFLRIAKMPGEEGEDMEPILMLLPALRTGLLLDLNHVEELKDWSSMFNDDEDGGANGTSAGSAAAPPGNASASLDASISTSAGSEAAGASVNTKTELSVKIVDGDTDDAGSKPSGPSGRLHVTTDFQPEQAFRDILSGSAGKERIAEIVAEIEKYAKKVNVEQTDAQSWVLRASDFQIDGLDSDEAKFVEHAELVVHYSQGAGITYAEMLHIGPRDGRMRFEFIDAIDASLLSYQRYVDAGVAPLDVSKLIGMFGGLSAHDDDEAK